MSARQSSPAATAPADTASGSHVFARHSQARNPVIASGKGVYLIDTHGKQYLDACGGAAVSCLGHGNERVLRAVKQQLDTIAYAHTGFFTSAPAEELADELVRGAPAAIDRVYFVSGGSEAVEASIKLARQFHLERGDSSREHVIARRQSYHGNTLGALATGGNEWRRRQFQPLLSQAMSHIDPCYYWRWAEAGESQAAYAQRCAVQLEQRILELGAENVSAFVAEPVVGATLGAVAAEDGYFPRIREICDRYGVLLILDEVMCGMGRTGYLFASEYDGIAPDIVCVAKGLGAGVQPIGAMLCSATIHDTIAAGSGFFQHGHTYLGHPAACAAGLAVLQELQQQQLIERVRQQGPRVLEALRSRLASHPNVGDVRGRGYFLGVEIVADRQRKDALDPALKTHAKIKRTAFDNGLMVYPMGGTIDGQSGDHVLVAPPFIASDEELDTMVELLGKTIEDVLPV